MTEGTQLKGKCPVCSGQLAYDPQGTSYLVCVTDGDHYRINAKVFDDAWTVFENHLNTENPNWEGKAFLISELMSALLTNNVAVNAPPVDPSKFVIPSKPKE